MMKEIPVSVVIPCFNHGQFIRDAIASVEQCDRSLYEIIIVDDGSSDPFTQQVMQNLKSEGYFVISQSNQGLAASRNNAIRVAKGTYILPLDADNKIRPNYIYKGIEIFEKFPDVSVVYGKPEFFGDLTARQQWIVTEFDLQRLLDRNYIDACALFQKSVWEECGGYDIHAQAISDWDFWITLALRGKRFYFIDEVLFDYRLRADSMIQTATTSGDRARAFEYMCEKHPELMIRKLKAQLAEKDQLLQYAYQSKGYRLSKKYWQVRDSLLRILGRD